MSDDRLETLLKRELDGEVTPVESEELERLLLASPSARAERRAWRRVERGLKNAVDDCGELDLELLASRIASAAARPTPPPPPLVQRWPHAVAGMGLLLLGAVVWTNVHGRGPIDRPPSLERAPVELDLDDHESPAGLVTIRL